MDPQKFNPLTFSLSMNDEGTFKVFDHDTTGNANPFYLKKMLVRLATDNDLVPMVMTESEKKIYINRGKILPLRSGKYKPFDCTIKMFDDGNFKIFNSDPNMSAKVLIKHVTAFCLATVPITKRKIVPDPEKPKKKAKK